MSSASPSAAVPIYPVAARSASSANQGSWTILARYSLLKSCEDLSTTRPADLNRLDEEDRRLDLFVVQGSVLDMVPTVDPARAGVVNAANEPCLGGGGVDGAITQAGGPQLARDRLALPILGKQLVRLSATSSPTATDETKEEETEEEEEDERYYLIRCRTGQAVITGPNRYGSLPAQHVIHAVGPNFHDYPLPPTTIASSSSLATILAYYEEPLSLLQSAYQQSLQLAVQYQLQELAFCLLSAGVYRGPVLSLRQVLYPAVQAMQQWALESQPNHSRKISLQKIYLCGFTHAECQALQKVCDQVLGPRL